MTQLNNKPTVSVETWEPSPEITAVCHSCDELDQFSTPDHTVSFTTYVRERAKLRRLIIAHIYKHPNHTASLVVHRGARFTGRP